MSRAGIKNIIFDLGGVIINLSVERTLMAFADLSKKPLEEVRLLVKQSDFFNAYEMGLIDDNQFRRQASQLLSIRTDNEQFDAAWNSMLLDIPLKRIELLQDLGTAYRIFLLSNTNNIHLQCFNAQVTSLTGKPALDFLFEKAYYSHLLKMRKPNEDIYRHVLGDSTLKPEETLFLDDNYDNLKGAEATGIKTFHVTHPDLIFTLFK